jgi:MFS family permease
MWRLLSNRNYCLLWLAQIISGVGDVLYNIGVMVTIFARTGSALQTAGVLVAMSIPTVVFGPLAGALVDRYPRQYVLILMDLVRAALVGVLLLLLWGDAVNVWGLYLVVAGLATATTFYLPARQAIIPAVVSHTELVRANSLLIGTSQATLAAGFLVGSLLVVSIPLRLLVFIDLLTFIAAACLVMLMRHIASNPSAHEPSARTPLRQSVRDGVGYLRHHDVARPLVMMEVLEQIPHGIWASPILLVFAERALQGGASAWSCIVAAYFGGQLIGALITAYAAQTVARRPGWLIIGSAAVFAVLTLVFALSPALLFAATLALLFGPPAALRDVAQNSLLQTTVAAGMLGRVYALRSMLMGLTVIAAGLCFAWLADVIPIRVIYLIGGTLYGMTALYALTSRALRYSTVPAEAHLLDAGTVFGHGLENAKGNASI